MSAIPKKAGKGPKLSKKERAELARLQALEAEQEALRLAEQERQRRERERQAAIEQAKRDTIEQGFRLQQLENTYSIINLISSYNCELIEEGKRKDEWTYYVNVGKLPYAINCGMMNTYLHLWEKEIEFTAIEAAAQRTKDVLHLLKELDYRIFTATPKEKENVAKNWRWIWALFRDQQARSLDIATYRRLRNIDKYLNRIDIPTADYKFQDENIALALWLKVPLPIAQPNPRRPQKPRIELEFPDVKLSLQFPQSLNGEGLAVRLMYLTYDHLSNSSSTFEEPEDLKHNQHDLIESVKLEWEEKLKTMPRIDGKEPTELETIKEEVAKSISVTYSESELSAETESETEFTVATDAITVKRIKARLNKALDENEINLRKYSILGGVYYLDLINQPPQPNKFVKLEMTTTTLNVPKQLEISDYYIDCELPKALESAGGSSMTLAPEAIEAHMKKLEQELEKLTLINLTWPTHVYFFELPIVCHWDNTNKIWTKKDVFDVKHNEEKCQLSFRTGRFGIFAFAAYRFANLPFQAWEIFPEPNGTVTVQITCAILLIEFNIKQNGSIVLATFQNSPEPTIMDDLVGVDMELPKLIIKMRERGVDIFPDCDTLCYVEGIQFKHWVMERHLYFNMAQLARIYNFAWSRWNVTAGYRNIILQMRDYKIDKSGKSRSDKRYKPIKQKNYSMLLVTPLSATFVNCTEVSQAWSDQSIEGIKFSADLWHLIKNTTVAIKQEKIRATPKELIWTIYQLLIKVRLCSFS